MLAIQTVDLTKQYSGTSTPSLNELNLNVEVGEIFGYLGPNGAGKTTTIRLLLDFIRPTAGYAAVLGWRVDGDSRAIRHDLGNLPGELRLWNHLTGRQILTYLASLRPGCDLDFSYELAERLGLDLNIRARNYSTGNKRKVGIIQAMMHRPALLILDEPTTGLDPLVRKTFNELLLEARDNGQTVFLSSHVLSEVQAVCDRVGILRQGQLIKVESMAALQRSLRRIVTIYSKEALRVETWQTLPDVVGIECGHNYVRLQVNGSIDPIIKHAAQFVVDDLQVEVARLEDLFMEYYHD